MAREAFIITTGAKHARTTEYGVDIYSTRGDYLATRSFSRDLEAAVEWARSFGVSRIMLDGKPYAHGFPADLKSTPPVAPTPDDPRFVAAFEAMRDALTECFEAEQRRRSALTPGAPASTYTEARLARIRAALRLSGKEI